MSGFLNDQLSKKTSIFGLRLWVVVGIFVGATIVILMFLLSLYFTSKHNKKAQNKKPIIPNISKDITEIRVDPTRTDPVYDPEPEKVQVELGGKKKHRVVCYQEKGVVGSGH